ncbi:hypothetical protein [Peribacillus tepidiphilus]|uniref:hypothetical protein n=1 Tax=Peribacillus tepidiphilus TaxID=2652445 RepID=UPI0035B54C60
MNKLFPHLDVEAEFYLAAAYGGTVDVLPMIGLYDEMPNCFHIYAYGDNGTVYNMVLGKIVGDVITKGTSNDLSSTYKIGENNQKILNDIKMTAFQKNIQTLVAQTTAMVCATIFL